MTPPGGPTPPRPVPVAGGDFFVRADDWESAPRTSGPRVAERRRRRIACRLDRGLDAVRKTLHARVWRPRRDSRTRRVWGCLWKGIHRFEQPSSYNPDGIHLQCFDFATTLTKDVATLPNAGGAGPRRLARWPLPAVLTAGPGWQRLDARRESSLIFEAAIPRQWGKNERFLATRRRWQSTLTDRQRHAIDNERRWSTLFGPPGCD